MSFFKILLDIVYPPFCPVCDKPGFQTLCPICLAKIDPEPLSFVFPDFNLTTITQYDDVIRKVIFKLKFGFVDHLANVLADLALPVLEKMPQQMTLVPVPIHPLRIRIRGFNQSALIARRLSNKLGWGYNPRLIWRSKNTRPQFDLEPNERARNVQNAFSKYPLAKVNPDINYMLVDDIVTTGSTLKNCARALKKAGAKKIFALAIARAFDPKIAYLS